MASAMASRFCSQCGQQLQEAAKFCSNCGTQIGTPRITAQSVPISMISMISMKSVGVAVALALVVGMVGFPGVGHLYLERIGRGILIFLGDWTLSIVGIGFLILGFFFPPSFVLAIVFLLGSLALFVWQIFDAANLAKEWNQRVAQTSQRPW